MDVGSAAEVASEEGIKELSAVMGDRRDRDSEPVLLLDNEIEDVSDLREISDALLFLRAPR